MMNLTLTVIVHGNDTGAPRGPFVSGFITTHLEFGCSPPFFLSLSWCPPLVYALALAHLYDGDRRGSADATVRLHGQSQVETENLRGAQQGKPILHLRSPSRSRKEAHTRSHVVPVQAKTGRQSAQETRTGEDEEEYSPE